MRLKLSRREREVYDLRQRGMKYREIAAKLNRHINWVGCILTRCRRKGHRLPGIDRRLTRVL